jgi:amino acid adenylation domain-containing protein/non-ribosomal peptide synthase protein (TIGR01720 family)
MERNPSELLSRKTQLSPRKQALLEQRLQGNATPANIPIIPRRSEVAFPPLSFAQQRLWFLHQLEPDNPFYNEQAIVQLTGILNVAALQWSLNEIVRRHDSLRTTFKLQAEQAIQAIAPELHLNLSVLDLSQRSAAEQHREIQHQANHQYQTPFDLAHGPLLRWLLLRIAPNDHVLLFCVHHIICDGWSISIIWRELLAFYAASTTGKSLRLPELTIQYTDFALWQRQWLQAEALASQRAYWRHQLADLPGLQLPTDYLRPAVQRFQGATTSFCLSPTLVSALNTLSQGEDSTLFMTLLAAFNILLHRYTDSDDIVVGSPIANRNRSELEGLIGFFVNTLVLRTDLSGHPTFRDVLQRVKEVTLGAYAHQDFPFEQLVEELQPQRSLSQAPLFQVMFILQNTPTPLPALPNLQLQFWPSNRSSARFDLTFSLEVTEDGLSGTVEYDTDLFSATTIERMVGHWQTLLTGIAANPDQLIADLPLMTDAEHYQLLVEWSQTQVEYPQQCLHQWFEARVNRTPDAIAVTCADQKLTYAELNRKANQLAHYLQILGVQPDTLVGVCVERSLEMMIGLLGILKAGGAYVPLDPSYPSQRLAFMLDDAQVPILLTQQRLVQNLPRHDIPTLCLDANWNAIAQHPDTNPSSRTAPEHLAYVIYTSGSTGQPKGVMNTHQGICSHLHWMQDTFGLTSEDRVLHKTPFSFDVSVWELFWPLLTGAKLVMAQPGGHQDSTYLAQTIARERITTVHFVPSMLQAFLDASGLEHCTHLKRVLCSGEALSPSLQARYFTRLEAALYNLYGPTEAAIDVTCWPCADVGDATTVPIGRPVANTQLYVLNASGKPVPVGVAGELHLGGVQLARGYLNRPEQTAAAFIPHPFSDQPGARLYKTGDLVRYRADGVLEYLGRLDHQVKVRGCRIELGEIEAALRQHPSVREAVVVAREDFPGEKQLVAYLTCEQRQDDSLEVSTKTLRDFLNVKLPNYMVPSAFMILDALPLTSNGKVDRKVLPQLDRSRSDLIPPLVLPKTPAEIVLAEIWSQILRREVGIHDNFFELGGDSILSLQIIARANQAGFNLTPKQLFQHQTIAELAAVAGTQAAIVAEQNMVTGTVPLTPIQHWFFEQNRPDPHHWNQAVVLDVQQPLNPDWLEPAFQQLLVHHDALRLRFERHTSHWQQVNDGWNQEDSYSPIVELFDVSTLPDDEQALAIAATTTALQTSLNLSHGPLIRAGLFNLGTNQASRLVIVIHHLVVDGFSWRILLEDLQIAYQQLSADNSVHLPPKTTAFQYWAKQLAIYAQSAALQQELKDWLMPAETQTLQLPLDYPSGDNTEASASTISVTLSHAETQALLQEVPSVYNTQINDVLLTALVQVLSRWLRPHGAMSPPTSIWVDLEGHGREALFADVDLSRTVGWFTTIFPVRFLLEHKPHLGEALKTTKEQLRQVPNRGIGYGLLRYLSADPDVTTKLRHGPQAEVMFNYLGQTDQVLASSLFQISESASGPTRSPLGLRSYVFDISGVVMKGQLQMNWTYSRNLHQPDRIERLAQDFMQALRSLIQHCQSTQAGGFTPSDFPLAQLDPDQLSAALGMVTFEGGNS